jgi:hypothetical protein
VLWQKSLGRYLAAHTQIRQQGRFIEFILIGSTLKKDGMDTNMMEKLSDVSYC